MALPSVTDLSFEAALAELEQIVGKLERGDVSLEESIVIYQRGAQLREHCAKKLQEAQEKVAKITLGADGQPSGLQMFDPA